MTFYVKINPLKIDDFVKTKNLPQRHEDTKFNILESRAFSLCLSDYKWTFYEIVKIGGLNENQVFQDERRWE